MVKLKKRYVVLIFLIAITLTIGVSFSKYVIEKAKYYILEANNFYFNSDKLVYGGKTYGINNWGGAGVFNIQFELNNEKNNILSSTSDISYTIRVECETDVVCTLNAESGTIYVSEKKDSFILTITPSRVFNEGEKLNINVIANSISPYEKELSARFVITVGKEGIYHQISDEEYQPYLNYIITNSRTSYEVKTAFSSYNIGDEISIEEYMQLSDSDKQNCVSALITLTFNPSEVVIDTTSSIISNSTMNYTIIDGISYISEVTFKVDALSNTSIRFYKNVVTNNYTDSVNSYNPVIEFTAV